MTHNTEFAMIPIVLGPKGSAGFISSTVCVIQSHHPHKRFASPDQVLGYGARDLTGVVLLELYEHMCTTIL